MGMPDELRPIGPGRFAFTMNTPWGQAVPAELLLASRRGWPDRPEASDPRWSAFEVGPAVVAIRLLGDRVERSPRTVLELRGKPSGEEPPTERAGLSDRGLRLVLVNG